MANDIGINLIIGALVQGGVSSAFSSLGAMSKNLGSITNDLSAKQKRLGDVIAQSFARPHKNLGDMVRRYQDMSAAIKLSTQRQKELNDAFARQKIGAQMRQERWAETKTAAMQTTAFALPLIGTVKAYMELESATTNMKLAFMKEGGEVGEAFAEVKKQAIELGNVYPGTTADFINLGKVLREQGVADKAVTGGGLKAAAQLNVLLDTPQEFGGEFIAKLMEARGIGDADLSKAADQVQRARFGFGIKPGDMFDSMKYDAPIANVLGLRGLAQNEKLLAVQGMGAQVGLEGAQFGTNFAAMLTRLAKGPQMLEMARNGVKGQAKDILDSAKIKFEFFDKNGQFKGVDAMVAELSKLNQIRGKDGNVDQEKKMIVSEALFGSEAGRAALIISNKGSEGYQANIQKMREQASLEERMAEKSKTLANAWESMTGTITNGMVSIGEIFSGDLKGFFTSANEFIGGPLTDWIGKNKSFIKTTVSLVGGFLTMKVGLLAASYAISALLTPLRLSYTGYKMLRAAQTAYTLARLSGLGKMGALSRVLGVNLKWATAISGFFATALSGLSFGKVIVGLRMMSLALLTSPIGWAIAAIATAALLIYKYWEPIKGFFVGFWRGISAALAPLGALVKKAFAPIMPYLSPVIGMLRQVWQWFGNLLSPVKDTGNAAQKMGERFGALVGKMIMSVGGLWREIKTAFSGGIAGISKLIVNWSPIGLFYKAFASVLSYFKIDLPTKFTDFGEMIIGGLIKGITNKYSEVKQGFQALASDIKGWFSNPLAIKSPSRVFMGFGDNIGEGARLGILGSVARVGAATKKMAGVAASAAILSATPALANSGAGAKGNSNYAGAGGSGMVIHFSPVINITAGADAKAQVKTALDSSYREFEAMMRKYEAERKRRAF